MKSYNKITKSNMDLVLREVKDFLPYYLFNGIEFDSFNLNMKELYDFEDKDINILKTVHFMLSKPVKTLIFNLHSLIRNLSHTTHGENEELKNNIKGSINWELTFKNRLEKGYADHNLFVCSTTSKYYDLEENQLLKFILKKIVKLTRINLKFIKFDNLDVEKLDENPRWYENIMYMRLIVEKAIKNVYFDEISNIDAVKFKHEKKCIKNRNPLYHVVFDVYELYYSLFIKKDKNILIDLINERIIKATNPDKVFELYVFFNIIKSLGLNLTSLMIPGKYYYPYGIIEDGTHINIYYQKTPSALSDVSQYTEILKNYDTKYKVRGPDIIIEFKKDDHVYYRIVEVKNPGRADYIRDSLYKVMGYYEDFKGINSFVNEGIFYNFTEKYPIILVVWDNISSIDGYDVFEKDKYVILNNEMFKDSLDMFFMNIGSNGL